MVFQKTFLSVLTGFIVAGLFSFGIYAFASYPGTAYSPGDTLNPDCVPGSNANCTVTTTSGVSLSVANIWTAEQTFSDGIVVGGNIDMDGNGIVDTDDGIVQVFTGLTVTNSLHGITMTDGLSNTIFEVSSDGTTLSLWDPANEVLRSIEMTDAEWYFANDIHTTGQVVAESGFTTTSFSNFTGGIRIAYGTSAPTLSGNGDISVAYVGGLPYIYFRANGTTYKTLGSSSFIIDPHETIDALSGEKMKVGDFVIGMVDKNANDAATPEESSLHGIWVKWDSVKKDLIQQITAGISSINSLVVNTFKAHVAEVDQLQMKDQATGQVYCMWIENGDWKKQPGNCQDIPPVQPPTPQAPVVETLPPTPSPTPENTPQEPSPSPTPSPEVTPIASPEPEPVPPETSAPEPSLEAPQAPDA